MIGGSINAPFFLLNNITTNMATVNATMAQRLLQCCNMDNKSMQADQTKHIQCSSLSWVGEHKVSWHWPMSILIINADLVLHVVITLRATHKSIQYVHLWQNDMILEIRILQSTHTHTHTHVHVHTHAHTHTHTHTHTYTHKHTHIHTHTHTHTHAHTRTKTHTGWLEILWEFILAVCF